MCQAWLYRMCADEKNLPYLTANAASMDTFCWIELCKHEWALPLLIANSDRLECGFHSCNGRCEIEDKFSRRLYHDRKECWRELCKHGWALPLVAANADKLKSDCWIKLCGYEWALPALFANVGKLDGNCWHKLCKHEWALPLLTENVNEFSGISQCVNCINVNKNNDAWTELCNQDWALPLITVSADKLLAKHWEELCKHEWALPLLAKNPRLGSRWSPAPTPAPTPVPVPAPAPVVDSKKTVEFFKKVRKSIHASYDLAIGCDFKDLHAKINEDSDIACLLLRVDTAKEAIDKYHALRVEASELAHAHNAECHAQNWERKAAVQLKHEAIDVRVRK